MELFVQLIIDTIFLIAFAMMIISLNLHFYKRRRFSNIDNHAEGLLKLKFGRIFSLAIMILIYLSMFLHASIFVVISLIQGKYPGLNFNNGIVGYIGVIFSVVIIAILFMNSVPNTIAFFHFFKFEVKRKIIINTTTKTIELYQNSSKITIRNEDINLIIHHEKKIFARGDEKMDYLEIRYLGSSVLFVTDLLTETNTLSPLGPIFKGVKTEYKKKYFNRITVANTRHSQSAG